MTQDNTPTEEPTPVVVVPTIQERLENIARAINNRYGEFPDADTVREAKAYISELEEKLSELAEKLEAKDKKVTK
jgi:vacuolar-type H+-ATPase subunit I/STV1